LLPHLEKEHHNFAEVYQTHCAGDRTTWFRSYKKLLRWRDGKFKVWDTSGTKTGFKTVFSWKGKCFVQKWSVGIMEVTGDSFQKLPGNEIFANEKIYMAVPYKNGKLFVGTRAGFYIYDGTAAVPFPTEADGFLKGKRLSHGIRLTNGDFAAATLNRGLVVFDDRGRLKAVFNGESCPMPDDSVKYVLEDSRR
ncbi:MAG: hypothetical protein GY950_07420, partial [bacterium]|nr:hypothetical protein [bacterium]